MGNQRFVAAIAAVFAILLCVVLAVAGGPHNRVDVATIDALAAERLASPFLTDAAIWITRIGSAPVTLGLSLCAAAFLAWNRQLARAAMLLAIVLGGRLMVDILKQSIGRLRPDLELAPVTVHSLSFPSGHAANSMVAFVAIALFCAPERYRKAALTAAIAASLAVGATRPVLGVHWPSDVLGGWIFGLLWAIGWWRVSRASSLGLGTGRAGQPLFGQRRQDMTPTPRDPAEQALIEDAESTPTPSQSGRTGGDMARNVGSRDELARAKGKDQGVTRVHKSDKEDKGDEPNLPNRN
jgi:undecaprenyl-diphosphatase